MIPAVRTPALQSIADYRIEKKLGEGGMGRVFKAFDAQGRAVAIKLLSQHLTSSGEALERFKQKVISPARSIIRIAYLCIASTRIAVHRSLQWS